MIPVTRTASFLVLLAAVGALLLPVASAGAAEFGLHDVDVTFTNAKGETEARAGTHPFAMTTIFKANTKIVPGKELPVEPIKDIDIYQIPGFIGDQNAVRRCATLDFLERDPLSNATACPDATAVGKIYTEVSEGEGVVTYESPFYNLQPAPGTAARLGFFVAGIPVTIAIGLEEASPYRIVAHTANISQMLEFFGAKVVLWGVPADPRHDEERGHCYQGGESCESNGPLTPFLTLPRACIGPLATEYELDSWPNPGVFTARKGVFSHDDGGNPQGMFGCGDLAFSPSIDARPTSRAAESSTGLDFLLDVHNEGLESPREGATAASDVHKAVVTLPEGMSANPSSANGLGVCTEAQLAAESPFSAPGEGPTYTPVGAGCPDASKLGTVEVETPIVEQTIKGSLYLAKPYHNPFGSLLALYMVLKNPELGVIVKQPMKVEPDPTTGQLVTTADDLPQIPFSSFKLHFREGARSPLITPPTCGTHTVRAMLYSSSGGAPVESNSSFEIITGPNGGACPSGGQSFDPGFEAGSLNNAAGRYSEFDMRLTRNDGDQDLTKFSAKLPPGMIGKLAGTSECSAGAIAQARSRTGQNGGQEELERPSCPASSQVGHVLAGAGVGSVLTYVPGKIYLAGPYKGAPLSVVAVVPALAGPFDAGTVVTQEALRINPLTAEVEADGSSSDPIPHILQGIPLHVRDVRVYVDRNEFTLNPTSCEESATTATLWSAGSDVFSSADDTAHSLSARFQAANCAGLGFKPQLKLMLKGGTKRGSHPALRGEFKPHKDDANLKKLVLRLPHSAFLDQAHIRTICTRVQFAANGGNGGGCPKGATYGHATAVTPILDQPLEGPVYLRSSNHNLPDFVAALHGTIDVEAVARIDSVHGGIRATFTTVPDAPLTKVVVNMQGGNKGLIINSKDLCYKPGRDRANTQYTAHSGKQASGKPAVKGVGCKKAKKRHERYHKRPARRSKAHRSVR